VVGCDYGSVGSGSDGQILKVVRVQVDERVSQDIQG
jgi:hypothetical protein